MDNNSSEQDGDLSQVIERGKGGDFGGLDERSLYPLWPQMRFRRTREQPILFLCLKKGNGDNPGIYRMVSLTSVVRKRL